MSKTEMSAIYDSISYALGSVGCVFECEDDENAMILDIDGNKVRVSLEIESESDYKMPSDSDE